MKPIFESSSVGARRAVYLLVPVLVAVVVRIAFLAASWDSPFLTEPLIDAREFHEDALAISSGEGLPARPFDRPPLFTYLVAAVYAVTGPGMRHVFPLQAVLGVATVLLTAHAAARLFGRRVGLVAGLVLALARMPLVLEVQLLQETLQTFLLTVALAAWVEATLLTTALAARVEATLLTTALAARVEATTAARVRGAYVLAGAVAGALAIVTRPTSALVVVPALAGLAILSWRSRPDGSGARGAAPAWIGLVVIAVAVGAVAVRNRVVGGEWVPISYNGGINFFVGNASRHDELMNIRPGLAWERLARSPRALETTGVYRSDPWADGYAAWDRRYWNAARADILADPVAWVGRLARKGVQFWSRIEIERNVSVKAFVPSGSWRSRVTLPFAAIAPFAFAGLVLLGWRVTRRRDPPAPRGAWLVVLSVAGVWATCIVFFVTARYRVPAYPALAILAAWSVNELFCGRRRAIPVLVSVLLAGAIVIADPGRARDIAPARGTYLEAVALERAGRPREALDAYRRALAEHPNDPDVLAGPMALLISTGQPAAAIPLGERAIAALPDHPTPLFNLGLADQLTGRYDEAAQAFARMTEVAPGDARAFHQLGRSLTLAGRPDAALDPLARAAALAPRMPLPHVERARALLRLGREEAARAALRRAVVLDPGVRRLVGADAELAPLLASR